MASTQPFTATRYHSLIVERKSLPDTLEISAETDDGTIMGLRHRKMKVEGVQFHPESVLTGAGFKLLENFLEHLTLISNGSVAAPRKFAGHGDRGATFQNLKICGIRQRWSALSRLREGDEGFEVCAGGAGIN